MFYWRETIMTFVLHFYPGFSAFNNVTAVLLVIVLWGGLTKNPTTDWKLKIQPQAENLESNHRLKTQSSTTGWFT